ncbi:MAG: hypothetical protein IKJ81_01915 [Bacteroidales bacterium]|nr:hypothetical protein [Bacteroidales bacterium]
MKRRKKIFFFECRGAFVARVGEFFCGRGYWSFLSMAGFFCGRGIGIFFFQWQWIFGVRVYVFFESIGEFYRIRV